MKHTSQWYSSDKRRSEFLELQKNPIRLPWYGRMFRTIVVFFDLDLLRDPVYVNLMMGINLANFTELNFSLLTPFILSEYGLRKIDVATIMSVLAGVDVVTRITIPFIATRIGWENRTFFLIGIGGIALGRVGKKMVPILPTSKPAIWTMTADRHREEIWRESLPKAYGKLAQDAVHTSFGDLARRAFLNDILTRITYCLKLLMLKPYKRMTTNLSINRAVYVPVIAHTDSYSILMVVAVLVGAGKALRTIFMALVIPTHVPLDRLPAATGLQLVSSGIIYLILGPLVGWIRDSSGNYTITLHCLNVFTYLVIISWTLEVWYSNRKRRLDRTKDASI